METYIDNKKKTFLWTGWHTKKSNILNYPRVRTMQVVMGMNGQRQVLQYRSQR